MLLSFLHRIPCFVSLKLGSTFLFPVLKTISEFHLPFTCFLTGNGSDGEVQTLAEGKECPREPQDDNDSKRGLD